MHINFFEFIKSFESYRYETLFHFNINVEKLEKTIFKKQTKSIKTRVDTKTNITFSHFKTYLSQIRKIKSSKKPLIIGLTPSRIGLNGGNISTDFLKNILKSSNQNKNKLLPYFESEIILLTTDFVSPLFNKKSSEKIYQIDLFLLFFFYLTSPSVFFKTLISYIFSFKKTNSTVFFQRNTIYSFFIYSALKNLLIKTDYYAGVLLNSNSFVLENFRFLCQVEKKCKELFEVLHYTPTSSIEAGQYFKALESFATHKKFKIIPQNRFEHFGFFNAENLEDYEINTNFNKFFSLNPSLKNSRDLLSFVNAEIEDTDDEFIIGFIGGNSHESEFKNSSSFKAEIKMLTSIVLTLQKLNIPHKIVYYKHPSAYLKEGDFSQHFQNVKIKFCDKFIVCYLTSDFVTGIISGGIFELAFYGLSAYIPFSGDSKDFPPNFFSKVFHPSRDEDPIESLEKTLNQCVKNHKNINFANKIQLRYAKI